MIVSVGAALDAIIQVLRENEDIENSQCAAHVASGELDRAKADAAKAQEIVALHNKTLEDGNPNRDRAVKVVLRALEEAVDILKADKR